MKKASLLSIVDIILLIGCLGLMEVLLVQVFWQAVLEHDALRAFRSGQWADKLAQLAIILGVIALFNYVIGLCTATGRDKTLRNVLALVFAIGLIALLNRRFIF